MTPELLVAALIKMFPDGKTTIPINLVVNKAGSNIAIDLKFTINTASEIPSVQEALLNR